MIVCASFLFATMGVCVKLASASTRPGEIVFYRGLDRRARDAALRGALRAASRSRTRVPAHARLAQPRRRRSRCALWFYAIGNLPLATAMTLNYMSSVWMALFLIGGAVVLGAHARRRPR